LTKFLLDTSLVFTLGSSSLVIPTADLLSKASFHPSGGIGTQFLNIHYFCLADARLCQPSAFNYLNIIRQMNKETKLRIHNITATAALKFGSEAWLNLK
jgi:hypothetical protein